MKSIPKSDVIWQSRRRRLNISQDAGYDMLNCDNGTYDAWYWAHPPIYMPENCNLERCGAYHVTFVDIPVVCAGRMDPRCGSRCDPGGQA